MSILYLVKKEKEKRGWTNAVIAKHLCVDAKLVQRWLKGKQNIGLKDFLNLCKLMEIEESIYMGFLKRYRSFKR